MTQQLRQAEDSAARNNRKKEKPKKSLGREVVEWVLTLLVGAVLALSIRAFIFEPVKVDGKSMLDTLQDGEVMFVSKWDYGSVWLELPWWSNEKKENSTKLSIGGSPERFDVVICHYPQRGDLNFVKRIIALPGDTVSMTDGHLTVNGEAYDEPYINDSYRSGYLNSLAEFTVPKKGDVMTYDRTNRLQVNGASWPFSQACLRGRAEDGTVLFIDGSSFYVNGEKISAEEEFEAIAGVEFTLEQDYFFACGDHRNSSNDSRTVGPIGRDMIVGHVRQVLFPFNHWRDVPNGLDVR